LKPPAKIAKPSADGYQPVSSPLQRALQCQPMDLSIGDTAQDTTAEQLLFF
jgi:hypothetical protein